MEHNRTHIDHENELIYRIKGKIEGKRTEDAQELDLSNK